MQDFHKMIRQGIPQNMPSMPPVDPSVSRAPRRPDVLSQEERSLALKNALRYLPKAWHAVMAPELAQELKTHGRIYMHRLRPTYKMFARPIDDYPAQCKQAAAIMLMIQNNLDLDIAQHPYELITYGGNGTVFQNWAQYLLTMSYLSRMTDDQTLILNSGHPLGLFPSHRDAPRLVVSNGMVIPNYSKPSDYDRMSALGVTSYGQMTAGSFMYIGPQGIVHGTAITLLNAGRRYLGLPADQDLGGKTYLTSGLGGMSGAQAKAAVIAGAVGIVAEINPDALKKRHAQGWLQTYESDIDVLLQRVKKAVKNKEALSIGYLGNIVDLWEKVAEDGFQIDLGSDQTSLHVPFTGGYYPAGLSYDEANVMMVEDPAQFKIHVQESLKRHAIAINKMTKNGMYFWDYGNAFLLEASRAGAPGILKDNGRFTYPSYVEDIMGPICFDYGFGPFRWVCASGLHSDLQKTDKIAADVLREMAKTAAPEIHQQILDNLHWIENAGKNKMVVGSKARILYADRKGRVAIAQAMNDAIKNGDLSGPVVLGRDHHDVSGTDSPFRETANIYDGSSFTADMAVQNVIGDAFRGATWVSIHNGGGVGWGEVINGGFGLVLDGTDDAKRRATQMLDWDVSNGLARRSWAGNDGAVFAIQRAMEDEPRMCITLPSKADDSVVEDAVKGVF